MSTVAEGGNSAETLLCKLYIGKTNVSKTQSQNLKFEYCY